MNIKRPIREEEKQIIQFLLAKLNTNNDRSRGLWHTEHQM